MATMYGEIDVPCATRGVGVGLRRRTSSDSSGPWFASPPPVRRLPARKPSRIPEAGALPATVGTPAPAPQQLRSAPVEYAAGAAAAMVDMSAASLAAAKGLLQQRISGSGVSGGGGVGAGGVGSGGLGPRAQSPSPPAFSMVDMSAVSMAAARGVLLHRGSAPPSPGLSRSPSASASSPRHPQPHQPPLLSPTTSVESDRATEFFLKL